jgi:hypothetical protein
MYLSDSEINEAVTIMDSEGSSSGQDLGSPQTSGQPSNDMGYDPNLQIRYKASGRDLNEPLSAVIQRASRGYDYGNLIAQFNAEKTQWEQQRQQQEQKISEMESRWKPYEEFATQNPQWADHVRQSWETRFNQAMTGQQDYSQQNYASVPPEIMKKLSEAEEFIQSVKQEREIRAQSEADMALNNHIDQIKQQYKDIDFTATDPETGLSLENRVLHHAFNNGINNFGAAFRDFYHDQLINRAVMKAREDVSRGVQQQNKQGFLGQSERPLVQGSAAPVGGVRNSSYQDLAVRGAREMGII